MRTLATNLALGLALALALGVAAAAGSDVSQEGGAPPQVDAKPEAAAPEKWAGEPYLLEVCAASGRPLDVKGTRTTKVIEGRELKFCCGGCADVVAKDPAKWFPKVDEKIKARQVVIYPTETCLISGEPLIEEGEDVATSLVVGNRLFRVCCKRCASKVEADPGAFAAKLDAMVLVEQAKDYPLTVCVVNPKNELDGDAETMVIGGRLLKTCCGNCAKKVEADPATYVAKVDAARAEAAKDAKKAPHGDAGHGAHGG